MRLLANKKHNGNNNDTKIINNKAKPSKLKKKYILLKFKKRKLKINQFCKKTDLLLSVFFFIHNVNISFCDSGYT
jgi:hypothetical protein